MHILSRRLRIDSYYLKCLCLQIASVNKLLYIASMLLRSQASTLLLRLHAVRYLPKISLSLTKCLHTTALQEPIKKLFDSQKYFANFNQSDSWILRSPNVGLFGNHKLKNPEGLIRFSEESLIKAKRLVSDMIAEAKNTHIGKLTYIRKLDQLSDILCRVIDVAEFIRVTHTSQKWVEAAQDTHEIMFEYMNQLNTNVELSDILSNILHLSITDDLSIEEIEVGKHLLRDFERSGISMDPQIREAFVEITQEISVLQAAFNEGINNIDNVWCKFPRQEFEMITDEDLKQEIMNLQSAAPKSKASEILIPLIGATPFEILKRCPSEKLRKTVWVALHNSTQDQVNILEAFLKSRAYLANIMGYKSYSHYQLEHKMAKTPQNVTAFLQNLQTTLLQKNDGVLKELKEFYSLKENYDPKASPDKVARAVKPWDRDYCLTKQNRMNPHNEVSEDISEYLSVGTIMSGLNKLLESIYNIRMVPERVGKGETWDHNQVRKLGFIDLTTKEHIGYLYVDFWSKKALPSHFTIVCSRELNSDLGTESKDEMLDLVHLNEARDCQLPVISLVCNFKKPKSSDIKNFKIADRDMPTLLTLEQVDTIFHEMGHAVHSMLGRTKLHNLSGTRCLADFVELPSVLMERFSNDPRVLCKIAKHYQTEEPLSEELLKRYQKNRHLLKACETYMQSKMALLDQALHDEEVGDFSKANPFEAFDSTRVYHDLERQLKVFSDEYSTWHARFSHLSAYGSVYYSYLLDGAIAENVWNGLFKENPWSREAGEKFKQSVLKWGGTRDPWLCLADALDNEDLGKGDARAMKIIGNL